MVVRGEGNEPFVLDRLSDRKMVEVLKCVIREPEDLMGEIVKEASHPGTTHSVGLSLQIEHLADHPCLPMEPPVEIRILFYIFPEPRDHCY